METETIPEAPKILGTAKVLSVKLITKYHFRESENLVRILLEHVLQKPYKWLLMHPEATFTSQEFNIWTAAATRLMNGEPIQYILGKAWFWGMELMVNPHVLIPRPETEELVEWVLKSADRSASLQIVDIGSGSGCIALALAQELPNAAVTGLEVSEGALRVAQANASHQGVSCTFVLMDVFTAANQRFQGLDILVSNPPYIPAQEWAQLDTHVRDHEPALALKVPDDDPLLYYRCITQLARHWLKQGGWLYFEVHEDFAAAVMGTLESTGFGHVEVRQDVSGRTRMVRGSATHLIP